jgi:hypothetical protein
LATARPTVAWSNLQGVVDRAVGKGAHRGYLHVVPDRDDLPADYPGDGERQKTDPLVAKAGS